MIEIGIIIAFCTLVAILAAFLRINAKKSFDKAKKENDEYNRELSAYLFRSKED